MFIISVTNSRGFNITYQTDRAAFFTAAGVEFLQLCAWDKSLHYMPQRYISTHKQGTTVYARYGEPRTIDDVINTAVRMPWSKGIRIVADNKIELYTGEPKAAPRHLRSMIFSSVYRLQGYYVFTVKGKV